MTDHLSTTTLSAFADGELPSEQAAAAQEHLDACLSCASNLIREWLLKSAIVKSGRRYGMPADAEQRFLDLVGDSVGDLIADNPPAPHARQQKRARTASPTRRSWTGFSGWATAAVLLIVLGFSLLYLRMHQVGAVAIESEACDLHIATLAANEPPQVVSSDRHTVKPWFQGKLPFSFNLPQGLPTDTQLDGANLAYLDNRPVAQLLFSLGRHRASVFIEQRSGSSPPGAAASHTGFQVIGVTTRDLQIIAVSDVDRQRLVALTDALQAAQAHP